MKQIKVKIKSDLFSYDTFITAQATSGTSTLTVKSIANFAVNQVLLIGDLGGKNSELIKTHASTAPTGTTITLASNLSFTHSIYTKVLVLAYDQIEFSHADTLTGAKSVLTTKNIDAQNLETIYEDSTETAGFYFYRFKNTITTTYSSYSDAEPYSGFDPNTVASAIKYALKRNKLESYTKYIDFEFCLDEINSCLRYVTGKLKRWSKLQEFDYVLGQTTRGINSYTLPSTIWENENNKSILSVRIGTSLPLEWKNKDQWNTIMQGVTKTQVTTEGAVGAITLEIDNSYDFADSGSLNYYISGTLYTITYTGVTRSATAGVLTGIPASGTGSITITTPVGTNVWQGESESLPQYYTVYGGKLYIWHLPDATEDNQNVYIDFYTAPTAVDSEGDTLDIFRYDAVKYWLTASMRDQLKNDGNKNMKDADLLLSFQIIDDYIRTEVPAHSHKNYPKINGISY